MPDGSAPTAPAVVGPALSAAPTATTSPSSSTTKLTFASDAAFQRELRRRVDAYFVDNGIDKTADRAMWLKVAFWLVASAGLFAATILLPIPAIAAIALWTVCGFCLAVIEMNVGHDAIHGSLSKHKRVNALFSWTFDCLGASSATWRIAHNLVHHTYTNVPGVDTDVEPGPLLRFHTEAKRYPWHRAQAVYAWALYCLVSVLWVYQRDFALILQRHPRTGRRHPLSAWVALFVGKAMHIGIFLVVPLLFSAQSTTTTLLGYLGFHVAAGLTLSVVFQLAHVVEGVRSIRPVDDAHLPYGFMAHELMTTANFGTSPVLTFFTGGLDHQVEHHLFPSICHTHYAALSPIVAACAREHGLPYLHSGSFVAACVSHTRMLHRLGRGEDTNLLAPAVDGARA